MRDNATLDRQLEYCASEEDSTFSIEMIVLFSATSKKSTSKMFNHTVFYLNIIFCNLVQMKL